MVPVPRCVRFDRGCSCDWALILVLFCGEPQSKGRSFRPIRMIVSLFCAISTEPWRSAVGTVLSAHGTGKKFSTGVLLFVGCCAL